MSRFFGVSEEHLEAEAFITLGDLDSERRERTRNWCDLWVSNVFIDINSVIHVEDNEDAENGY